MALLLSSLASLGQVAAPSATAPPKTNGPRAAQPKPTPAAAVRGRTTVDFAKGFTINYVSGGKLITILSPFEQKTTATRYLLVPRGAARPAGYAGAIVIETPIRTLVGLSSMHVAQIRFGAAGAAAHRGGQNYRGRPGQRAS
jgi:iron complex transport system substrate-binding protein